MKWELELPAALARSLQGRDWTRIAIGESKAQVHRLTAAGRADLILKVAPIGAVPSLENEAARLRWLRSRARVAEVVDFVKSPTHEFLLQTALPGKDAASAELTEGDLIDLCADALREWHAIPVRDCPFRHSIDDCIAEARWHLDAGWVDASQFNPENLGRDPHEMFGELLTLRPVSEVAAFTHGDFCLPNIMVAGGRFAGCVDLGRAGVGDPYRDLALAARSVERNTRPDLVERLFKRYGLKEPDTKRLRFFRLLDEFL